MAQLLDGKALSLEIRETVKSQVEALVNKYGISPHLAVILVGENPASQSYVKGKETACHKASITSTVVRVADTVSETELLSIIDQLNADDSVHGILLQLPIPKHLNADIIIERIRSDKDVDGFTPKNVALLTNGQPHLVPCTPLGIIRILKKYSIPIEGKHCVVIGRSQIVGKPMAALLLKDNGTVTICHSRTADLRVMAKQADILVVAMGKPKMIDGSYVKKGATVIDVGISKVDGVIVGDVDFESASLEAGFITPVPGGVGPMTIACLLENTLTCYHTLVGA
jgi:methylenetetrahydrofolate dehydrogenase (NADP+) / methenyltetrahydrofolate cyclohydrolase